MTGINKQNTCSITAAFYSHHSDKHIKIKAIKNSHLKNKTGTFFTFKRVNTTNSIVNYEIITPVNSVDNKHTLITELQIIRKFVSASLHSKIYSYTHTQTSIIKWLPCHVLRRLEGGGVGVVMGLDDLFELVSSGFMEPLVDRFTPRFAE